MRAFEQRMGDKSVHSCRHCVLKNHVLFIVGTQRRFGDDTHGISNHVIYCIEFEAVFSTLDSWKNGHSSESNFKAQSLRRTGAKNGNLLDIKYNSCSVKRQDRCILHIDFNRNLGIDGYFQVFISAPLTSKLLTEIWTNVGDSMQTGEP